jgi:hypothetical protein
MRIDYRRVLPGAVQAMSGLEQVVHDSTLEPELLELVKMRASQLERLRALPRHALEGRARPRRERATPARAGRLARRTGLRRP